MKKSLSIIPLSVLLFVTACEKQNLVLPADFTVDLDENNTYVAGEPVHFHISGDADYILFFSGEEGHEYRYSERTEIAMGDVDTVYMNLKFMIQYGQWQAMSLYISDSFCGLLGNSLPAGEMEDPNGLIDRATMSAIEKEGMPGWIDLEYKDPTIQSQYFSYDYPIYGKNSSPYPDNDFISNFNLAFHWTLDKWCWDPDAKEKYERGEITEQEMKNRLNKYFNTLRTYYVDGSITMKYGGGKYETVTSLADIDYTVLNMAEIDPPYLVNYRSDPRPTATEGAKTRVGTVGFGVTNTSILFTGCDPSWIDWKVDDWCVSKPLKLNSVSPDTGVQIKSMLSPIYDYDYTFEQPGTYTVSFYGVNASYQGTSSAVREVKVIIVDKQ